MAVSGLSHSQRKELHERGPHNLVFHGIKPDWIEDEMDDDPEFKRDVLEQKIRNLIREEVKKKQLLCCSASNRVTIFGNLYLIAIFAFKTWQKSA